MPLLFHIFYFAAIPKKYMEIKLFKPGGVETFHSCCIGVLGTIIYIPIRIGTGKWAFPADMGKYRRIAVIALISP